MFKIFTKEEESKERDMEPEFLNFWVSDVRWVWQLISNHETSAFKRSGMSSLISKALYDLGIDVIRMCAREDSSEYVRVKAMEMAASTGLPLEYARKIGGSAGKAMEAKELYPEMFAKQVARFL